MGRRVFMDKYPTKEEIIADESNSLTQDDLIEISNEPTLYSRSSSWRDTDLDWEVAQSKESKNDAIRCHFQVEDSELDRFLIIDIGRLSNHSSSFAQCSTYTDLYLVLDTKTKIGYYLEHKDTMHDGYLYS